jgi:hypothetical protein
LNLSFNKNIYIAIMPVNILNKKIARGSDIFGCSPPGMMAGT